MLPLSKQLLEETISKLEIFDIKTATIRQICGLSAALEEVSGENFVHLELGNPGLAAEKIGIEAECKALQSGIANKYPDVMGIKPLKKAGSDFVEAFLDLKILPAYIIPTVGSMQGCYTLFTLLKQRVPGKDSILFFYPGFPAQTHQAKMLGLKVKSFDIYNYRGDKLKEKLEELLEPGDVTAMIYSNPNNPSWSNFTHQELEYIGHAATKYDVIVIEDLAYLGMDFRKDYSEPYKPPFIPTVGKFTDNYVLMISASKIFSYAGQRVAIVCFSPKVFNSRYPALEAFYEMPTFGECYVYGVLYTASSGVAHSAQYAMAEMLSKSVTGELSFMVHNKSYGERSKKLKKAFLQNGFHIVYDKDGKENISDGFFFTIGYKDLKSEELQKELMRYGISSISLPCTGSKQDGIRACVSMLNDDDIFEIINQRLCAFNEEH